MLEGRNTSTARSVLDLLTSFAMIAAASLLIYKNVVGGSGSAQGELQVPSNPLSLEGAQLRGSNAATAVMIEYADFQCPFCARFAKDVFPEIDRQYVATGKIAVAFRHLPLAIHAQAVQAASVAECAGRQGRFWQTYDRLYGEKSVTEETLGTIPEVVGLDQRSFDECLKDPGVRKTVQSSAADAQSLGIHGTPTFFFGQRDADGHVKVLYAFSGARPFNDFAKQLDAILHVAPTGLRFWLPFAARDSAHSNVTSKLKQIAFDIPDPV